ncbi:MAG: hypothetical protein RQ839_09805, partial [Thermoproteus sp.]|nr:hypothetical protein [Thermoproteus sp.]
MIEIAPDPVVLASAVLAAALMLIRGDPRWTHPVMAAVAAMILVPAAVSAVAAWFGAPMPAGVFEPRRGEYLWYVAPAPSLQEALDRNYAAIHAAMTAVEAFQRAMAAAVYAAAFKDVIVSVLLTVVPGGQGAAIAEWAAGLSRFDPVMGLLLTMYNAATSMGMVYHLFDAMADLARRLAVPLLSLSALALTTGRTRALGGLMAAFALLAVLLSYTGYYLSPLAVDAAQWGNATAAWGERIAQSAAGSSPPPLLAVEGAPDVLYLARYNNTFVQPSPAYLAQGMRWVANASATPPEDVVEGILGLGRSARAVFNGSDWVAATTGSVAPVAYGNKTWRAYAVLDWLDFPAPTPQSGSCVEREGLPDIYRLAAEEASRGGNPPPPDVGEWLNQTAERACRFAASLGYRSYFVDVRPPPFWRLLAVDIRYTALGEHGPVGGGVAKALDGVWGWLSGPDNETCINALGNRSGCAVLDTTIRAGLYNFSLLTGRKSAVDPVAGGVADYFNFSLPKASLYLNKTIYLYTWTEVCTWTQGNKTYTSSRQWWDAYSAQKVDEQILYNVSTTIYGRPWVVREPENYTAQIPVVGRSWDISVWSEHGPWDGPTPPGNATCTTEDRHVYKTIYVYDVRPRTRILYGFWWLQGGVVAVKPSGGALPGVLWDNSTSAAYVEGAESQFYCSAFTAPASTPDWRAVPAAEGNLTALLRDDYFSQVVLRNFTRAVLRWANYSGFAAFASTQGDPVLRAVAASGRALLESLDRAPAVVPMYYTAPGSYRAENFLVACVAYDWRGSAAVNGSLALTPAAEWWVARYALGDSRVAGQYRGLAEYFKAMFNSPPPPPPAALAPYAGGWDVPWDNRALPYAPYYGPGMAMPPMDRAVGVALWDVSRMLSPISAAAGLITRVFQTLFLSIFAVVAAFELLASLFEFPSPSYFLWRFATGAVQEWTYWLPVRLTVGVKVPAGVWRAVRRPFMRASVRIAARAHALAASRIPALRRIRSPDLREYYREYVKRRRDIAVKDPAEQIREEINVKWRREALERIRRAVEERADVEWMRNLERRREEERRRALEMARRVKEALRADNIVQAVRELSPRIDAEIQEKVEITRHSLSYYLFWWRLDRLPFAWRSLLRLDPHVIARLEAEGRIRPEEAEALLNLRAAAQSYVREFKRHLAEYATSRYYVEAGEELEKARQMMLEAAEKGHEDFRRFIDEFGRRYEALRRYFSGDLTAEGRAEIAEEAKKAVERLEEALRHFAVIDKAPRARLVSALNESLQRLSEGRPPQIPRDASAEDVVKGLALMDLGLALKALRSAERYLEAHYAVAPTRYDPRQIAAEIVKWRIEERIPTLRIAGLARGVVLGARSIEEGEMALRSWAGRTAARRVEEAPWEAVAHRASLLREQRANAAEAVRIGPDVVLLPDYARYLAGFRVGEEALEALRKAVEYRRVLHMLERAEELRMPPTAVERLAAEAERLRQEVLRETSAVFRRFGEDFFFVRDLLEGRRVVRREALGARSAAGAFGESPLYDEVKHLIDEERARALVRAPLYSYVVDRLGHDLLRPTYARWYSLFVEYGPYLSTAFEHARTSAAKAGAPLGLTGGFSYARKMMGWLGDFSREAVMRGLKAYYRGEGRPFRELAEMTIRGAKVQLYEKAAELARARSDHLLSESKAAGGEAAEGLRAEAEGLRLLASVLRAKAAYEEIRLVQTYLRGAERRAEALLREAKSACCVEAQLELERRAREGLEAARKKAERHLADARARYRAHVAEIRGFVKERGDVREVAARYFGLTARAFAGDPQEVAERMVKAVDVRRVISWADELARELGEVAVRVVDAERIYARFEKVLRAKAEPIPPAYDLRLAEGFFEGPVPQAPKRSRAEEAVPRAVRDVFTAYYSKLREAAERASVYLALMKGDGRFAKREVERARQALLRALRAGSREEALAALEDLKKALKALGIDVEGDAPQAIVKAVEERARPAYEEYAAARREYAAAVDALAKFSPEAALALGEMAREAGPDPISRWMALTAYEARERALREYARHWARPLEERWNSLPQPVREIIAKREEAAGEVLRRALRGIGIIVKRGAAADLAALEDALAKVFTANGEWGDLGERVERVIEAARRVQRGEAPTDELARAVDALLAAYGTRAAERFVESDRLEDAVDELREAMRRYARNSGLRMGREAAERALLLGLSAVPQEHMEAYTRGGWRGRIEPYVAYWTEDAELARRAGEAGWEVRQIKRPASFEEGVPKEWRTAYVVAPRGVDLAAVERAITELVDGAPEGLAYIRPAEWPAPEPFIWFVLRDRMPARDGEQIMAYSIDRLSVEEPLSRFGEALRARDYGGARRAVGELYDARLNRTVWQVVYEFDRPRARDALEYLGRRYGEPYERLWERHDELYLTWLAFRLADEFESYLRSGAGRELKAKEEVADVISTPWLLRELTPAFMYRLVGDEEGWPEFRAAWITAVNMWFEGLAEPYTPKKPSAARRALELFNAFVGAGLKYEELFPPPQKAESVKPEAARAEAVKSAKPEPAEAAGRAEPEAVRQPVQTVEGRGLRREVRPQPAEAVEPAVRGLGRDAGSEAVKAAEERGLGWAEPGRPRAPIADVIPDGAADEASYLVGRFGAVLDREAAFSAHDFAAARVRERLERAAAREPEFAHILGEAAGDVLSHFGLLMASPDAARHVRDALLYFFEGYQTKDGERLYLRIEPAVREAVRRAEEAGIPDAEYRVKQFVLEILDVLARAGERYRRQALEGISTVERALRATAFAGLSAAAAYSAYQGLYSEAVISSVASAIALADAGQFREAVEYAQRAARALYESAKELFERAKVAAERLAELFVEAVARVLAWVDEHKAYLFLTAAVAAGLIALSAAMDLWGLIELGRLAYAVAGAPLFAGLAETGERAAERFEALAERYMKWRIDEGTIDEVLKAPQRGERPYVALLRLAGSANPPRPLAELRRALARTRDEAERDAAVVAALALYKALIRNAEAYKDWAELYRWARGLAGRQEFTVKAEEVRRLRGAHKRLEEAAELARRELNGVLASYSQRRDVYERLRPLLEVDLKRAEGLAEARGDELSKFGGANMGTKAYAALLSIARGGIYGHAAVLLAGEGALADIVLSTPATAYNKASDIASNRGEAVDPSRSPKGAAGRWEDRAASALLRYLLGRADDEDLKFRRVREGFDVFRTYGGVEAHVDTLKVGETAASSKAAEEESRRFVEEAKGMAPDLSGTRKIRHTPPWLATDVSFLGRWIEAATAHPWQAAWYIALFGEPESIRGKASVTEEGVKLNVNMRWPREVLDRIIAGEGGELEPLLGRPVKGWRDLVDAIGWSQVLERVGELAGSIKPWIGRRDAKDAEREGLARRMLGELALFAHFAEARRGLDDGSWREERVKRLSRAVEALSGGRIKGGYAERLANLIIYYAEGNKKRAEERIDNLAGELAGISRDEVWRIVDFALSDMYCLARDCARDEVARKFVEPALELIMLDKAARGGFDRREALLWFGEMYATAIAGDGAVESRKVELAVGGELGGGAALLRLAALRQLNELLSKDLKFGVHTYVKEGRYYYIAAYGGDAARLMRLLAVAAPSAGGGYLSPKFEGFVEEAQVDVRLDEGSIRRTKRRRVAADLTISEGGADVKYNVYLRENAIMLQFVSTDRSRVELAARLLKLAGVDAEVKRAGDRDEWYVEATTDRLAAGRKELRNVLAEIVRKAAESGWVNRETADRWLDKLRGGITLREGWPKYYVGLARSGALEVRYETTNSGNIEREARRLEKMGLEEGRHFTVKMPEGGGEGYVSILKEGLAYAAFLSVYGEGEQQKLAAKFVEYILERAEKEGKEVFKKAQKIIEEGKERGSLKLEDFEKKVEVNGRPYVVKVIGGEAVEEDRGGRKLLRIKIKAEVGRVEGEHIVDPVVREYTITFGRRGSDNAAEGRT